MDEKLIAAAGWPIVVLVICLFILMAFRKDIRELLGRVKKIGKDGLETHSEDGPRPSKDEKAKKEWEVSESIAFYNEIADVYDSRQTRENLDTLRTAADVLLEAFPDPLKKLSVLDVGAGTGQFQRFFEKARDINWTCIEPSLGMGQILRELFQGPPFHPNILSTHFEDAPRYLSGKFDAIVLNFVISSLDKVPDLSVFRSILAPNGILIISDAHPDIRAVSPQFRVRSMDGIHALKIQHRSSAQVTHEVTKSGLYVSRGAERNVPKGSRLYSYVLSFCAA